MKPFETDSNEVSDLRAKPPATTSNPDSDSQTNSEMLNSSAIPGNNPQGSAQTRTTSTPRINDPSKQWLVRQKLKQWPACSKAHIETDGPCQIFVKGTVIGFPAILQALFANWPFGVTYVIETKVIDDPNQAPDDKALDMAILPRLARGPFHSITRFVFLEAAGLRVGDKRTQNHFVISANNKKEAERFISYPEVFDKLLRLEKMSHFTEITIKANAGLALSQPKSFNSLDLDVTREIFKVLGELGQVLFEAF